MASSREEEKAWKGSVEPTGSGEYSQSDGQEKMSSQVKTVPGNPAESGAAGIQALPDRGR